MKTSQKPEICPHLTFDERGYHYCSLATDLLQRGHVKGALKSFLLPPSVVERLTEEIWKYFKPHAASKGSVLCAYFYDFCDDEGECSEEDVPKMCPKGFTYKQIETMVKRLRESRGKGG